MKNRILLFAFSILFSSVLLAQPYTETFEGYAPATAPASSTLNSFTNNGQLFNLSQVGAAGADKFSISTYGPNTGYGPSNNYVDNHMVSGVGNTFSVKTNSSQLFSIKKLYLFASIDNGLTVGGTGTVTINLLLGGTSLKTFALSNSFFLTTFGAIDQGFTLVDFTTAGGSDNSKLPIDEIRFTLTSGYNYIAFDNFIWAPSSQWTGTTDNVFATTSNWINNTLPSATREAYIPSVTNNPLLSGTQACNNLTIASGASLTVPGTLSIAGAISNAGTLTATAGTIVMNGSTAQTIPANTFATNTIKNLTTNNTAGVTLAGTLNLTGTLTPTAGAFTTGGFLTLKSTSITNTAQVGVVTGSISGNVTIERFIPASGRSFRFLSSGVTTTSSIKTNWQENVNVTNASSYPNAGSTATNPNAGYGTHITGSTTGTNGFDATLNGNASMFTFNNSTQAWTAVANTNVATLAALTPYRILVRGDRSTDLRSNTPTNTATILRATGTLTTGAITYSAALAQSNAQYSFVSNPYWAAVDWTALTRTNIGLTYWIWDPTIAGSNGRGGYTSFTRTGAGTGTPSGGGSINKNIQPGQAFFILNTAATPSLGFVETNKDLATALTSTFRTQGNSSGTNGMFVVKLFLKDNYAQGQMADAATLAFSNQFSNSKDAFDAVKFANPDESISFKNGNDLLGMEARVMPTANDTAFINIDNILGKNYVLEVEGKDFDANYNLQAYLIDNYLKSKTLLSNTGSVNVVYAIDNNAASSAANRFMIVIENKLLPLSSATDKLQMSISPNPATDYTLINYAANAKGNTSIRIINANGQSVANLNLGEQQTGQYKLPVGKLATGVYSVTITIGKETATTQLVKQ